MKAGTGEITVNEITHSEISSDEEAEIEEHNQLVNKSSDNSYSITSNINKDQSVLKSNEISIIDNNTTNLNTNNSTSLTHQSSKGQNTILTTKINSTQDNINRGIIDHSIVLDIHPMRSLDSSPELSVK